VNTNGLAKHYDKLTPRERLSLIVAASGRGDEAEQDRLVRSAPRVGYSVPDFFGRAQAFVEVSVLHLMKLLDLAGLYFRALGLADSMIDDKQSERMLDCAMLSGFLFNVKLAGWRLFCAGENIDPEVCWTPLPGYSTVKEAERMAEHTAFSPEGVVAYMKRAGRDYRDPPTAEQVAVGLRETLEERAEWWG
jgi:hypothetical protein